MKNYVLLFVSFLLTSVTAFAQTCLPPSNVTLSNATNSTLDLSWVNTNTANDTLYDIEIGVSNFTPTGIPVFTGIHYNPFTIAGLQPNTTFCVYMRSVCASSVSAWTINTACGSTLGPTCQSPSSFGVTGVTQTTANLSWTNPAPLPTMWEIEIVLAGSAPLGVPTDTSYTMQYTATNLTPSTSYQAYIRSHCSPTNVTGWSLPITFNTAACQAPNNISFSNTTSNSTDILWVDNNTPASTVWDLEIGPSGFTPTGTPTHAGITSNPFTLTGLTSNTNICAYIRSQCSANNISPWTTTPYCFTTLIPTHVNDFYKNTKPVIISPNPSSGNLMLNKKTIKDLRQIIIYDVSGKKLKEINFTSPVEDSHNFLNVSSGIILLPSQTSEWTVV